MGVTWVNLINLINGTGSFKFQNFGIPLGTRLEHGTDRIPKSAHKSNVRQNHRRTNWHRHNLKQNQREKSTHMHPKGTPYLSGQTAFLFFWKKFVHQMILWKTCWPNVDFQVFDFCRLKKSLAKKKLDCTYSSFWPSIATRTTQRAVKKGAQEVFARNIDLQKAEYVNVGFI